MIAKDEARVAENTYHCYVLLLVSLLGAALSLIVTGFVFGANNNIYHLPIVASLYDEPQFAHDPFIQSLRYFASGFWLLFRGTSESINPYWLFLVSDYVSRVIAFAGFLFCAELLGIKSLKQKAIFVVILAFTALLRGIAVAGAGGLFMYCFTHSEIGNGLSLLCLGLIIRRKIGWALAVNGLVFFINAFIAVWNFLPLLLITSVLYFRKEIRLKQIVEEGLIGGCAFLLIAAPVIVNIFSNPEFGKKIDFDYVTYLSEFCPVHFLFSSFSILEKICAGLIVVLGFVSFYMHGKRAQDFSIALAGYVVVYAIGIILPHITHNMMLLNLHLLRVSVFFHLLAALGAISLIVKWLDEADFYRRNFLAPTLTAFLGFHKTMFLAPFFIVLFSLPLVSRKIPDFVLKRSAYYTLFVGTAFFIWQSCAILKTYGDQKAEAIHIKQIMVIGSWIRENTSPDSLILVPRMVSFPHADISYDNAVFQYASHRRIWVDFKAGAAVMWSPSYYDIWWPRVSEVIRLSSLGDKVVYAKAHDIDYIMDYCEAKSAYIPIYRTSELCLYSTHALEKVGMK